MRRNIQKTPYLTKNSNFQHYYIPPFVYEPLQEGFPLCPWGLNNINVESFWEKTRGDGRVIAVIDSGLDVSHPEFENRIFNPRNFTGIGTQTDVTDVMKHGTHVSGTCIGKTVGVAPLYRVMPLKVFSGVVNGVTTTNNPFAIHDAFDYLVKYVKSLPVGHINRPVVVNCSFGGTGYDSIVHYFIRQLYSLGVPCIVSAGNSGDGDPSTHECFSHPAFNWEVITTGAMNEYNKMSGFSNSFDGIDLCSPGESVLSSIPGGKYAKFSGTSMSAPHVTGACALIISHFFEKEKRVPNPEELEKILFNHVRTVNIDPFLCGRGFLDLTWNNKWWDLYRIQLGAYYYETKAEEAKKKLTDLLVKTNTEQGTNYSMPYKTKYITEYHEISTKKYE